MAADKVVDAIRGRDWVWLQEILARNPQSVGSVTPWQRPEGPPLIKSGPEVEEIPELMLRYPGKLLVRYDIPDELRVYKLEVIVEPAGGHFRVLDFWGLGW
jgi:hypothetical protein